MWLAASLRRGLYKPPGLPRIAPDRAPRGLMLSVPADSPAFYAARNRWGTVKPANIGASARFGNSAWGSGATFAGSGSSFIVAHPVQNTGSALSIEVLVIPTAVGGSNAFCGYNNNAFGNTGIYDKTIGLDLVGRFNGYVFPGGDNPDTVTTAVAGRLYHLVLTDDSTTSRLYVNGVETATKASSGSYQGYTAPHFLVGGTQCNGSNTTTTSNAVVLLANLANVAWTPAEVRQRYAAPLAMFDWPDDELLALIARQSVARRPILGAWV